MIERSYICSILVAHELIYTCVFHARPVSTQGELMAELEGLEEEIALERNAAPAYLQPIAMPEPHKEGPAAEPQQEAAR